MTKKQDCLAGWIRNISAAEEQSSVVGEHDIAYYMRIMIRRISLYILWSSKSKSKSKTIEIQIIYQPLWFQYHINIYLGKKTVYCTNHQKKSAGKSYIGNVLGVAKLENTLQIYNIFILAKMSESYKAVLCIWTVWSEFICWKMIVNILLSQQKGRQLSALLLN